MIRNILVGPLFDYMRIKNDPQFLVMESSSIDELYNVLDEEKQAARDGPDLVDLLKRGKEELGLSQRQLAHALSVNRRTLQRILNRQAQKIDLETFQKIQQFLDVDPQKLLDIYNSNLDSEGLHELERAKKAGHLIRNFDLKKLKRAGFISSDRKFEQIENRLKEFFDINSVYEFGAGTDVPMFSRTRREYSNQMLEFWVVSALQQIRAVDNSNSFDREMLKRVIPRLKRLTRNEETGLLRAARALYSAGVTVIVQRYLTGTQIRGATFVVNDKPAIVLTDFNKRYDTIWFALVHELYHVLKDLRRIEKLGYHVSGEEQDLFVSEMSEEDANEFASELLLPQEKLDHIRKFIDIPEVVRDHAEKWNVHPSVIYGQYVFEHGDYDKYNQYRPKADKAVEHLRVHPWDKESIEAATEPLKEVYAETT